MTDVFDETKFQKDLRIRCIDFLTTSASATMSPVLVQKYVEQLYLVDQRISSLTPSKDVTVEMMRDKLDSQLVIYKYGQGVKTPDLNDEMLNYTAYKNIYNIACFAHYTGSDDVLETAYPVLLKDRPKQNLLLIEAGVNVADNVVEWTNQLGHRKSLNDCMNIYEDIGQYANDWQLYKNLAPSFYQQIIAENIDDPAYLLELFDRNMKQSLCPHEHLLQLQILPQCMLQQPNHANAFIDYKKELISPTSTKYSKSIQCALANQTLYLS